MEKVTESSEETKEFAREFVKNLTRPAILALYGNLGSGKTTFIQGLARGLGIEKRILSPTFVFIRSYDINDKRFATRDKPSHFHHVDLYRLDSEKDVEAVGLSEILNDKNSIVAIEWPEKIESLLPQSTIKIKLDQISEDKRKISIN